MNLTPEQQYQHDLQDPSFHDDPSQANAICALQRLYQQLMRQAHRQTGLQKLFNKRKAIKGLYLWGGVGTGKSYLMNTFYNCLTFSQKKRLHFHEFMRQVHYDLAQLQGAKNPLDIVAKNWAKQCYVLCFDEFYVKDIADAMLLGNLLIALFKQGVCLVATSNRQPNDLYERGLQRERFLPAIKILIRNVKILKVDNAVDYRLEHIKPADVYFTPLAEQADQQMLQCFHYYAGNNMRSLRDIKINRRDIPSLRVAKQIVWFDFSALCEQALGSGDYLELAKKFAIIMISDIPALKGNKHNSVVRFINLIDVLYDKHSLLIASAQTSIQNLYQDQQWAFEFERTKSRLLEMSSEQYINECEHKEK